VREKQIAGQEEYDLLNRVGR